MNVKLQFSELKLNFKCKSSKQKQIEILQNFDYPNPLGNIQSGWLNEKFRYPKSNIYGITKLATLKIMLLGNKYVCGVVTDEAV